MLNCNVLHATHLALLMQNLRLYNSLSWQEILFLLNQEVTYLQRLRDLVFDYTLCELHELAKIYVMDFI